MTTTRLIRELARMPDDAREREYRRLIMRCMWPRFILGFVLLVAWTWVRRDMIDFDSWILNQVLSDLGTLLIVAFILYPLLSMFRMPEREFDDLMAAEEERAKGAASG